MTGLRVVVSRVLGLFRLRWRDGDLQSEIDAHLDLLEQEHLRRGLTDQQARFAARREFGAVEAVKLTYSSAANSFV